MNKDCVLNPVSGRAVKITSRIGKKIMKENSNPQHDCLINPKTGRAVKRTTKLGKEILKRLEEPPAENAIRPPPRTMNPALLVIKNKVDNEQFFSSKLSSPSSKASSKASSSSKASYKSSSSGGYNQASPQYV